MSTKVQWNVTKVGQNYGCLPIRHGSGHLRIRFGAISILLDNGLPVGSACYNLWITLLSVAKNAIGFPPSHTSPQHLARTTNKDFNFTGPLDIFNSWRRRSFNWQSTAFVMRGLWVRLPPVALWFFSISISGGMSLSFQRAQIQPSRPHSGWRFSWFCHLTWIRSSIRGNSLLLPLFRCITPV